MQPLLQVFSKVGDVKRIVMGLDKQQLTPCGFCFVVYYTRADTEDCVKCASRHQGIHRTPNRLVCMSTSHVPVSMQCSEGIHEKL